MKKLTITLAALVVLLSGFMVREYVAAPDNWINQVKAKQAFEKTQALLVATYRKGGEQGLNERCADPIETNGYWFTCYSVPHFSYETDARNGEKEFFVVEAGLFRWRSKVEAGTIAAFRRSPSWRHSSVYRVAGEDMAVGYYIDPTQHWAGARFVEIEKRLARPEDKKRGSHDSGSVYP